jgi:hypothetical protein
LACSLVLGLSCGRTAVALWVMPPPPRVLQEFYKTKTVEEIERSKGHKRSGFARVQLDGGSRWTQQWVVLDVGGDCAVVCLARDAGPVKPAEVLSSAHYSAEPLDPEEAQGPSDFCFQLTDFSSSPPRHHLFSIDSAEDRDGWLDAFDDHGEMDGETGTGFSVTDMTGNTSALNVVCFVVLHLHFLRSFSLCRR